MPTDDGILAEFLPQQDRQDDALDTSGWLPGQRPEPSRHPAQRHHSPASQAILPLKGHAMRAVIAVTFATIATIVPASAQTFECAICDLPTVHVPWPDYAGQAEQEWRQQRRDIEQSYQQSLRDLQQQRLEQQRTQTLLDGLRNLQPNMQPY